MGQCEMMHLYDKFFGEYSQTVGQILLTGDDVDHRSRAEHLAATFLRNHPDFWDKVLYFGPMGCRTGNYLLLKGDYESKDIVPLITETFEFIRDFVGAVPGATPKDCGNYQDMNLDMAKYIAVRYLEEVLYNISPDCLVYPD